MLKNNFLVSTTLGNIILDRSTKNTTLLECHKIMESFWDAVLKIYIVNKRESLKILY